MRNLIVFVGVVLFFVHCGERKASEGVVINGVRWATSNVDAPGTFAPTPESPGKFFQWNRRRGWNVTDETIENWDIYYARGLRWNRRNDPCPAGWRVPTRRELQSLYNAGAEWVTQNGVEGLLFGNAPYQLFLPAVGFREVLEGRLSSAGKWGSYWSSTQTMFSWAYHLIFFDIQEKHIGSGNDMISHDRALGKSIRCVAR